MATAPDRAVILIETGVLNGPSTVAQRQRVLAAYATLLPAGATNAEIARVFVTDVRDFIINRIRKIEHDAAARNVDTQIKSDLVEQP